MEPHETALYSGPPPSPLPPPAPVFPSGFGRRVRGPGQARAPGAPEALGDKRSLEAAGVRAPTVRRRKLRLQDPEGGPQVAARDQATPAVEAARLTLPPHTPAPSRGAALAVPSRSPPSGDPPAAAGCGRRAAAPRVRGAAGFLETFLRNHGLLRAFRPPRPTRAPGAPPPAFFQSLSPEPSRSPRVLRPPLPGARGTPRAARGGPALRAPRPRGLCGLLVPAPRSREGASHRRPRGPEDLPRLEGDSGGTPRAGPPGTRLSRAGREGAPQRASGCGRRTWRGPGQSAWTEPEPTSGLAS